MSYTEADLVETLIQNAIGYGSTPELEDEQIEQLVSLAMPTGEGTSETLQRAAIVGWGWKSALLANQYDLKAASGASLTRHQWFDHCIQMAAAYRSGALSVDGETIGNDLDDAGFGVVTVSSHFLTDGYAS